ncbi:GNAT family N-acetyltransferase [Skermania sp. ID1734]|uniref:GNAT family N-acetyltransferase n=1 Tax=Skermania sp. ID1734 TaxID=2597516 RepID=UPI00117E4AF4|nr:GNAT family N-acetyltransferase [Skermania sp. ID1734]TSD96003.1 GNAT family N-acetyltransferase [Skermania sp. ID1734]
MTNVDVDVSRAGLWDAEALSDVAAATFPLACPPDATAEDIAAFVDEVLSIESFGDYLSDPAVTVLKATNNGKIVGYTMLVDREPEDPNVARVLNVRPTLEISKMYVLPDQHGTGVSTALMAAAIEHARSSSYAGVWLGVNEHNARAQRFYTKNGFTTVGTKKFLVGSRSHHDFVMQRAV